MAQIQLRFYEELNDFIALALRKIEFSHNFDRRASVKDMIESFGTQYRRFVTDDGVEQL